MLAGTPGFQPAEQLRAQCVGVQCDVYALGGVLLVVFTERQLWVGLAPFQIMYKVTVENAIPDTSGWKILWKCYVSVALVRGCVVRKYLMCLY